jgi:hypothetical protein
MSFPEVNNIQNLRIYYFRSIHPTGARHSSIKLLALRTGRIFMYSHLARKRRDLIFSFFRRYSPNLGLGLPPWNSPFHFGFLELRQSVGFLGRVISSLQGLYLYTNTEKRTHKHQTSMAWVGFEPTIPASEQAKTVHALDRPATVTGKDLIT